MNARLSPGWSARFKLWSWGASQIVRYGVPDKVFAHYGGIGDALMMTTVIQAWQSQQPHRRRVWVLTEYPDIFRHERSCAHALRFSDQANRLLERCNLHPQYLHYTSKNEAADCDRPPPGHLIELMARIAGVHGSIELRPRMTLTSQEVRYGRLAENAICIQSTAQGARHPIKTKEWNAGKFAEVVVHLRAAGHRVIQLGSKNDPGLPGVEDWRGATTIRQSAALLHSCRLFVGLVGGLMHLARSVDCPAVIIYGGREEASQSGYSANLNICRTPPCSPCWLWSRCTHDFSCMRDILPTDVIEAVTLKLGQPRHPLQVDFAALS